MKVFYIAISMFIIVIIFCSGYYFMTSYTNPSNNSISYIAKLSDTKSNEVKIESSNQTSNMVAIKSEKVIVYDGLSMDELVSKIEANLNYPLSGHGAYFASTAISLGVDPYLALAIVLHETGCKYGCSSLVVNCHNIGGQKGSGCGEYAYFDSVDAGIYAFLSNLANNYFSYGLNTASLIGPKYAEDPLWSSKVNKHIYNIKNG